MQALGSAWAGQRVLATGAARGSPAKKVWRDAHSAGKRDCQSSPGNSAGHSTAAPGSACQPADQSSPLAPGGAEGFGGDDWGPCRRERQPARQARGSAEPASASRILACSERHSAEVRMAAASEVVARSYPTVAMAILPKIRARGGQPVCKRGRVCECEPRARQAIIIIVIIIIIIVIVVIIIVIVIILIVIILIVMIILMLVLLSLSLSLALSAPPPACPRPCPALAPPENPLAPARGAGRGGREGPDARAPADASERRGPSHRDLLGSEHFTRCASCHDAALRLAKQCDEAIVV